MHKMTQIHGTELLLFMAKNRGPGRDKAAISNRVVREHLKAQTLEIISSRVHKEGVTKLQWIVLLKLMALPKHGSDVRAPHPSP